MTALRDRLILESVSINCTTIRFETHTQVQWEKDVASLNVQNYWHVDLK